MLISKKTHCFNCGSTNWTQGEWNMENPSFVFRKDLCYSCNYGKITTLEGQDYLDNKGESTNFMTSDPRFYKKK